MANTNKPSRIDLISETEDQFVISWVLPISVGYGSQVWRSTDPNSGYVFHAAIPEGQFQYTVKGESQFYFYKVLSINTALELSDLTDDFIKIKFFDVQPYVLNGTNLDVNTFKTLFKELAGDNGLVHGLEIDQEDWINSSTDVLNIAPGSYMTKGEIIDVKNSIEIQNIFANTQDGDYLFFITRNEDASTTGAQVGWGVPNGDHVKIAKRIGNGFLRVTNLFHNLTFNPQDTFVFQRNGQSSDDLSYKDRKLYDGKMLYDGSNIYDGRFVE